jgi:hypothetical protein
MHRHERESSLPDESLPVLAPEVWQQLLVHAHEIAQQIEHRLQDALAEPDSPSRQAHSCDGCSSPPAPRTAWTDSNRL